LMALHEFLKRRLIAFLCQRNELFISKLHRGTPTHEADYTTREGRLMAAVTYRHGRGRVKQRFNFLLGVP